MYNPKLGWKFLIRSPNYQNIEISSSELFDLNVLEFVDDTSTITVLELLVIFFNLERLQISLSSSF